MNRDWLGVLFWPDEAINELSQKASWAGALRSLGLTWLGILTGLFLLVRQNASPIPFLLLYLLTGLELLFFYVFKSVWLHLFAEILGGTGQAKRFVCLLAYSSVPLHLFLPFAIIANSTVPWLIVPVALCLALWCGWLGQRIIQVHYGLSARRAIWVGAGPSLLVLGILAVFLFAAFFVLASAGVSLLKLLH